MPGKLLSWPDWPEYTVDKAENGDDLVRFKKIIVDKYGKDSLVRSWIKVCQALATMTDEIAEKGSSVIPEVQFEDFFSLTAEQKQKIKDVGCLVIRNVFSKEQTAEWYRELKDYIAANRQSVAGMF